MRVYPGSDHGDPALIVVAKAPDGKHVSACILASGDRVLDARGIRRARKAIRQEIVWRAERLMIDETLRECGL
jgi:hypothetical protein